MNPLLPSPTVPEPPPAADPAAPPVSPPAAVPRPAPPVIDIALGVVDLPSEIEMARYIGCEAIISLGTNSFVDTGMAFAEIRDF